ncbi:MAG: FMN-dependent dehydrogenase, partial [Isoptericola variabilis]|nr:FMN-dependent dehydrogenase [Isoptericola variabilis]
SGQPRVTARFTAIDDAEARATHRQILTSVREIADVPRARLAAVVRGRSHYLAP